MSLEPKNGIRLSDALARQVDELAQRTGEAPLAVVGKALGLLRSELDAKEANGQGSGAVESVYQRWEKAGLIGCAEGLPSDLSTDQKHMEGFGRG